MACLLTRVGPGSFTAPSTPATQTINIALVSAAGAANIVTAMAFQHGSNPVDCKPAGNAFKYAVIKGKVDLLITFQLSGAAGTATLVEDCGGAPGTNPTLASIPTDQTAGLAVKLSILGT